MTLEYVYHLADPRATLAIAGGKGASLARLCAAGLPVPDGFHLATAAYQQFVAENELQPRILAALEPVDADQPATLETASRGIRALFSQAQMPPAIAGAIAQAYATLPGDDPAVAVRSSATAEDLPDLSFAGQQDTFLNVQSATGVLDAVRRCWASLWTARAIGYRARHGIDQSAVSLAVVVQVLVPAEAAGVLFTANPVTGQRDQAMLTATWGLGEAIVGGQVTPDTLTVDKATGGVLARETADKQAMTVRVAGGTEEQPVPDALRRAPVLDDRQAAELVRLGVQIEQLYGTPMDIEWTLADGQFSIVQARPITALPPEAQLPEPEAPVPTEWKLPDPEGKYRRDGILELSPDPLTPLFATIGLDAIDAGTRRLFQMMTGRDLYPDGAAVTINDYAYLTAPGARETWAVIKATISPGIRLLREAERRWREEGRAPYLQVVDRWQSRPLDDLTGAEILTGVREIVDAAVNLYTILQSGFLGNAMVSEILFTRLYDRMIKREEDPPALTYLLGFDSTPILAEKSLYDLAEWCRTHPALAAYVADTPAGQLAAQLEGGQVPPGVEAEDWREWQSRFRAHLREYGHTIYDLDFAKPVPADDPAPLLETCKMFLGGQAGSPYARQQALAERREQATQATLQRLKGLRLRLFRKLVTWAQKCAPLREDGIADLGLGYPLLRRMLRELGRRFVRAGVIEQADDIFWLTEAEVEQTAATLEKGEPVSCLAERIPQRKAVWRAEKRLAPPTMLPQHAKIKIAGIDMTGMLPAHAGDQAGDTIKGTGTSPGRVTGTARVLHGTEDFEHMNPGEVLVARITTPAWTPLFAMASAVVTDVGGPLSHGSIVAREYGIPAVLGTGVATKRIRSGQLVTVDGSAGTVTLSK
jgi:phosphohistidine swiveling domain-containing protein